jgi:hypothetical protein
MHKKIYTNLSKVFITSFISLSLILIAAAASSIRADAASVCNLSFAISPNTTSVQVGGNLSRTVTVKNTGPGVCKNASFSLYYSNNETFVSSDPAPRASNYYWMLGNLVSGKQSSVTVVTKHSVSTNGTTIDTEGCATASNGDDACATSSIAITSVSAPAPAPTPIVVPTPTPTPAPVVATATPATPPVAVPSVTPTPSTGKEQGMWVWDFPKDMLASDAKLKTLQTKGFNTLYITVDDYLDIASMSAGTAKTAAINTYFTNLAAFVKKANSYGMQVDAEAGWRDWAKSENRYKGFAIIDMAKAYNAAHPEARLRGFQYDVEPYLLPEYETNKGQVLTDFATFIDQSAQRLVGSDLQFGVTIPHFYDDVVGWTPKITYGGTTDYTYNVLLKILEKKPGSTILLMSYRNTFDGTNGTRAVSETEVKEATGTHTNVIVGQETGNVDPAYVTFYGMTKTDVSVALSTIGSKFSSYANYGGTAVDYLDPYMALGN